jgi:hypothetical protein
VPDYVDWNALWLAGGWVGSSGTKYLAIVGGSALWVPKNGEGLHDELQFGWYRLTVGNIRMVAAHQRAVGAGDFLL